MILLRAIDTLNILVGRFVAFLIYAGIFILCYEVVARYAFGAPTIWAHGYTQRTFGAYFVLIGAYTLIRGDHVRVDIFLTNRGPRARAALDLLNYAFLILWGTILVTEGWSFFEDSWRFNERDDSALRHPMWPIKLILFVGAALITLQGIAEAIRSAVLIAKPDADVMRKAAT